MGWQVIQPPCETLTPRDPEVQKSLTVTLDEPPTYHALHGSPEYLTGDKLLLMGLLVQGATSRATTRCPVTLTSATLEQWSTPTFLNKLIADLEELGLQAVHRAPERSFSVVSSRTPAWP